MTVAVTAIMLLLGTLVLVRLGVLHHVELLWDLQGNKPTAQPGEFYIRTLLIPFKSGVDGPYLGYIEGRWRV